MVLLSGWHSKRGLILSENEVSSYLRHISMVLVDPSGDTREL
jgi:hypothetical protein